MDWKLRAPYAKLNSMILEDTILNGDDSVFHDHKNKRLQFENDKGKKMARKSITWPSLPIALYRRKCSA